jgi:hypothetical protein
MTAQRAPRRFQLASPVTALVPGLLVLALIIADVPLAALAHQGLAASGGSLPPWLSAPFVLAGCVVAWRKRGNPLGWIILGIGVCLALSEDAGFYAVANYRLRHGSLPLGWVALLAQPTWAPAIVLFGLAVFLFPDGRPPSRWMRWMVWVVLAAGLVWIAAAFAMTVAAIIGHHLQVDPGGNLVVLDNNAHSAAWWNAVTTAASLVLAVCWVAALAGQAFSYRRSSGERRQQLKWLLTGSVVAFIGLVPTFLFPSSSAIAGYAATVGFAVILLCIGLAVLKYRLFDIDRVLSRTLTYAIVTGLLIGVYAGIVLLATQVLSFHTPVAVAASTLIAAALFNPVRRRVQRLVNRWFNRGPLRRRPDRGRLRRAPAGCG